MARASKPSKVAGSRDCTPYKSNKPKEKAPAKPKEKAPVKPSPVRDKEKLRQEIREKFRAAFGHEKI